MKRVVLYINIILFSLTIIYCKGCKKQSNDSQMKDIDLKTLSLYGEWKVIPSFDEKIVFYQEGRIVLLSPQKESNLYIKTDKDGLGFFHNHDDLKPFGYFLYDERGKNEWFGVWDGKFVKLSHGIKNRKSILE